MTAQELIQQLKTLTPETKIVVRGYEDGYNDIFKLRPVKIKSREAQEWYYGRYEDTTKEDAVDAIELFGDAINPKDDL